MNYDEALKYIHSLGKFSMPAGLSRIKAVLESLGNPQNSFKAIHIAGTNGKGSTAAMLSSVFRKSGYKTGLFTSPYIVDFRERIQINGEFIDKESLVRLTKKVIDTKIALTEFELITAVGFLYFSENKCDIAIIETGLGGRFDATNTMQNVAASVITKIGLDHTAILGDTIEEITAEKCGIIRNDVTVTVLNQEEKALSIIKNTAKRLIIPQNNDLKLLKSDFDGNEFLYKGVRYTTALAGEFQVDNAVTVIETVLNSGFNIRIEDLQYGIANTSFPARVESFFGGRIILDGTHNPDGAAVLKKVIEKSNTPRTAIIGMMKDKDYPAVLAELLPLLDRVIAVKAADMPRALAADELRSKAERYCKNTVSADNLSHALSIALEQKEGKIFVFGSLYLAAEIRPLLLELK